jgi:RNA polymerase sigma-70 factor (ECF subfamily)
MGRILSEVRSDNGIARYGDSAADSEQCERAWLRAVASADRAAFERLYLRYHPRLTRFLGRMTVRRDLIDETVNETLWAVWNSAARFRGDSKVGTWIFGIAYRCLMKVIRDEPPLAEQVEPVAESSPLHVAAFGQSESEQRELRDWVQHGLSLLPHEQQMTMELAYYLGQSCEEIAGIMNCAVGTVKARMFHARLRLRNTLPNLGGDFSTATRSVQT